MHITLPDDAKWLDCLQAFIRAKLELCRHNVSRAARSSGVSRSTLHQWFREWGWDKVVQIGPPPAPASAPAAPAAPASPAPAAAPQPAPAPPGSIDVAKLIGPEMQAKVDATLAKRKKPKA